MLHSHNDEPGNIPNFHLGFCPLGFIPTTMVMMMVIIGLVTDNDDLDNDYNWDELQVIDFGLGGQIKPMVIAQKPPTQSTEQKN